MSPDSAAASKRAWARRTCRSGWHQRNSHQPSANRTSKATMTFRFMNQREPKYRPNVAGILRNRDGKILICERIHVRNAWQFPQGGVDEGETLEEALVRELWEEIGLDAKDF